MSPFSRLSCWEIMNCATDKECPAKQNPHRNCWELFCTTERGSFNICRDCIVYISRQERSTVSPKELEEIMFRKGFVLSPCGSIALSAENTQ